MAMTHAGAKAALLAEFQSKLRPKFQDLDNISDLSAMDFDTLYGIISDCIAILVEYIQTNAKATGTDVPGGDSHNLSIT